MNEKTHFIRHLHKRCGVYAAIHRDSGMVYVGSSVDMRTRIRTHLLQAKAGSARCFHRALREFGHHAFDFECLRECSPLELIEWEKFYIALMGAATLGGFNTIRNPAKSRVGTACSEVTKQRISAAQKGRVFTPEHIQNSREARIGLKASAETKAKMSATRKGRKLSPVHVERLRECNRGRVVSAETREKMRQRATGRPCPESAKAKLSAAIKAVRAVKKW